MARDFDDEAREYGPESIRDALDAARFPGPEFVTYGDEQAPPAVNLAPTAFVYRDPATIPRRQFLYGFELRRKQVSATVAPGAAGKTTLKIGRAICMALGRDLFGHRVWNGPHCVWLWNLEDELEEVEKTVHAFLKLWNIDAADLGDRLYIDGSDHVGASGLKLAVEHPMDGFKIQRPVSDALIEAMAERKIDYLDIDPFVSSHSVNENSNQAIDAVAKEWLRVARDANAAVNLTHHVRKSNAGEMTAQDARGAGAMVNAARSVLVLQGMSKDHAESLGVPECERRRYFNVYDDKNNKAPAAASAEWYQFVGVGLGNGDETGPEDNIGACERWQAPDAFGGVTARQLHNIQVIINDQPDRARKHSKSKDWVGKIVAHVLDRNLDSKGEAQIIDSMIRTWLSNGALCTVERADSRREVREFVEVGQWAIVE
ncbi:MAG: AAA family ATPase [Pseudomonadota bacterium]